MSGNKSKKQLVYGFGATGLSVARFMQREGIAARYYDSRDEPPGTDELRELHKDAEVRCGGDTKGLLQATSGIVVSPGIPDDNELLREARKKKIDIRSDIDLFVEHAVAPFVAVTGSNGKSTVSTLLELMCDAAGKAGLAGANLGKPALDLLAEDEPDYYILELSSFQLQRTERLPASVAALLNISPDHLDWHKDEDEYSAAKYRIFREAEAVVFNRQDGRAEAEVPEKVPTLSFALDAPLEGQYGLRAEGDQQFLARGDQLLLSVDDIAMVGRHNQLNALTALAVGQFMGLPLPPMLQVLNEFPGLPHRMQRVDTVGGANFINDSKATNVGAAVASVEAIDGFVVLIAGGVGKGGDFASLAKAVHQRLRCAVLIGEDASEIEAALHGLAPTHRAEDMSEAVRLSSEQAEVGDTVLLAPACASFDQYPNYMARGDDFCAEVEALRS